MSIEAIRARDAHMDPEKPRAEGLMAIADRHFLIEEVDRLAALASMSFSAARLQVMEKLIAEHRTVDDLAYEAGKEDEQHRILVEVGEIPGVFSSPGYIVDALADVVRRSAVVAIVKGEHALDEA